jgi:energy-converting hydrogenase Eha subunit G
LPWTIAGSGVAVAAGGLAFYLAGKNQIESFHNDVANACAKGCKADLSDQPALRRERDGAVLKGQIAATMMIAGGAVAAGGLVLAILNRPVRKLPRIEVAPTPGGMTASVGWEF